MKNELARSQITANCLEAIKLAGCTLTKNYSSGDLATSLFFTFKDIPFYLYSQRYPYKIAISLDLSEFDRLNISIPRQEGHRRVFGARITVRALTRRILRLIQLESIGKTIEELRADVAADLAYKACQDQTYKRVAELTGCELNQRVGNHQVRIRDSRSLLVSCGANVVSLEIDCITLPKLDRKSVV